MFADPDVSVESKDEVNAAWQGDEMRFQTADEDWWDSDQLTIAQLQSFSAVRREKKPLCKTRDKIPCRTLMIGYEGTLRRPCRASVLRRRGDRLLRRRYASAVRRFLVFDAIDGQSFKQT